MVGGGKRSEAVGICGIWIGSRWLWWRGVGAVQGEELHSRGLLMRECSGGRGSDCCTWERSRLDRELLRLVE